MTGRVAPLQSGMFGELDSLAVRNVASFARVLRNNAFKIGLKDSEDALRILDSSYGRRPSAFRSALKALFCTRHADWAIFDELFDAFWLNRGMKQAILMSGEPKTSSTPATRRLAREDQRQQGSLGLGDEIPLVDGSAEDQQSRGLGRMEGASRTESLAETDFRKIADPEALAETNALTDRLAKKMRTRLTRREQARHKGPRLDLRRTIHRNIAHGGIPIELVYRDKRPKPLRLVILLDASGSMSMYTSFFMRFLHGVLDHFREAEAFLFHTRLVHISEPLRSSDAARAFERLSLMVQGVGGGTKIGESLAAFNKWHAARVVNSRTCMIILSDGYDTGPPEALVAEMQRLKLRCRRIVWLNPMMGWDNYAPEARGMRAVLPLIDLFASAHNLKSLAALEPYLAAI
jgi:uncharacterized protein with von Willebrand factor type A (vWA) domain